MSDYELIRQRHLEVSSRAFGEMFARVELPADELDELRVARLRTLVRTALQRSSWHADRLQGVDIDGLGLHDLGSLPTMDKDDLMANWDDIVTDRRLNLGMVDRHLATIQHDAYLFDEYHAVASGGSSGRRGTFVWGWDAWATAAAGALRWPARHAMRNPRPDMRFPPIVAMIRAGAPTHMSRAMADTFAAPNIDTSLSALTPIPDMVEHLNRLQPDGLGGYASILYELAVEARAGRLQIAPTLVTSDGEPLLPEIRALLEEVWGAPVGNVYGTSEGCITAASCYEGEGMHVSDDLVMIEPVDEHDNPTPPGELSASVLLTNWANPTLPLIRYRLTDRVRIIPAPCPCGSTFTRIDDVQGRLDHVFSYPDGTKVHPHVFRTALVRSSTVVDYEVAQTPNGVQIEVVTTDSTLPAGLEADVATNLRTAGLVEPDVMVTAVASIERTPAGKLRRFVPLPPAP